MRTLLLVGTIGLVAACSDPAGGGDAGPSADGGSPVDAGGRAPRLHRPSPTECTADRGPGDADPGDPTAECTADAECTGGDNGRCLVSRGGARTNYCSYDACFADADCASMEVCHCREAAIEPHACVGGDCVVDADCGPGGYCSPSRGPDRINYPVVAYYCHTPDDECIDDEDCRVDAGGDARCTFFADRSHWACSSTGFFPP